IRPRRGADPDLPHPCYLRRDRRHDERARVSGMPSWDVEPGAADGPDALSRRGPGAAPLPRAVPLVLVEGANVVYRHPEALLELGGERLAGPVYLAPWDLDLLQPDTVEAFGVFEEGPVPPRAHVIDDPACGVADLLGE